MVEVSVIVPTTLATDEAVEPLGALARGSFEEYEVIVRRDDGAAHARNVGIARASGEKLVFLDDDSVPHGEYLERASAALDEHPAVAGRVLQPPDAPFRGLELPWYDQGDEQKRTDLLPGCNMAIRREVIEEVGGFDEETFGWGHEESELAERISRRYYIQYVPDLVVEHTYVESFSDFVRKSYLLGRADVRWWRLEGKSLRWLIRQSLNSRLRGETRLETVRRLAQRVGWVVETIAGR